MYFLVLDDVWNEDREKWEKLKTGLSALDSARGRIIVTTSSAQVASITGTLKRCDLRCLSEDECWSILKHKAGIDDSAPMSPDLEKIGREIVKRCGGVPLVAQVFGSRMHNKTKEEWLSIQKTRTWDLPGGERILSDLKLSFDNLKSPFLKQCFAYCSMFKKDFEIEKDNLIQLWMAQGLPFHHSPNRSDQEIEDIGNEYFNTLWENCLFHDATKDDCGTITKCKMHDVVHDFAELVAISESLTWDSNIDEMDGKRTIRHVAGVTTSVFEKTPEKLRSLFSNDAVPSEMLPKFTALRVLNLYQADIEELPSSIGKLKQLRYLNVSRTEIKALPTTIGMLHNLQTLRMQKCKKLKVFPKEVQDLVNLRHIYFDPVQEKRHINFGWYRELPVGIGKLTNLRTIPCFIVGLGHGIEELALLNKLKGILTIYDMEHVSARGEAKKANLVEKRNIFKLTLVWSEERKRINNNDDDILQGLELPSNLETLEIHNFMGAKFSSWMPQVPLQSLKKIRLLRCNACEEVPIFGHLPNLTHVEIDTMSNLKTVGKFYGYVGDAGVSTSEETKTLFPALKTLRICTTPNLIKWMEPSEMPNGKIVVFPFLEELTLSECPQLKDVPNHFPTLCQLEISICHELSSLQSVLDKCTSLQDLEISSCDGLISMSIQSLRSLRKLVISFCGGLTSVGPQRGLEFYSPVSLEELSIKWCRRLEM
ncbi:putative disease resistance protein RGA3 [Prunus avium]|uniref:Disease resistance protein RGA3 n=1 Tax=Prunus avium TaxID=42229 RepID=A0A6P5S2S9_PRUAV|nr:putative disease resistance protein RGA3 [Prunus avium]